MGMPPFLRLPSIDEELTSLRNDKSTSLITCASSELELLRVVQKKNYYIESHKERSDCKKNCICASDGDYQQEQRLQQQQAHFPSTCLPLLRGIAGNGKCVDCGAADPNWASVSYGILLCLNCSGRHRGFGVQTSIVRSLTMDSWSHSQVLSMLEGGNDQLLQFFHRHSLSSCASNNNNIIERRYKTKAALFYREKLSLHVDQVIRNGHYQGREAARATTSSSSAKKNKIKKNGCSSRRHSRE